MQSESNLNVILHSWTDPGNGVELLLGDQSNFCEDGALGGNLICNVLCKYDIIINTIYLHSVFRKSKIIIH